MNTLIIFVFASLALFASAKPSGHWEGGYGSFGGQGGYSGHGGYGHGHLPLVGASGVVSSGGAAGPAGIVNGHGAIGPNGEHNSLVDDHWGDGYGANEGHGHGHLPLVGASGVVSSGGAAGPAGVVSGHGAIGPNGEHNAQGYDGQWHGDGGYNGGYGGGYHHDGQWRGEGFLASQDWAGRGGHGSYGKW